MVFSSDVLIFNFDLITKHPEVFGALGYFIRDKD